MSKSSSKEILTEENIEDLKPRDIVFTIPNFISLLRILSIPLIAVLIAHRQLIVAIVILAFSAASDGLDGYIARRFNQISKIGQILDPIADRLLIILSVTALGVNGVIPWWVLVVVALRDFVLGIEILILAQSGYGPLPVHFVGKVGTALLLVVIPVFIVSEMSTGTLFHLLHLVGIAISLWALPLYWLAGIIYIMQGYRLLHGKLNEQEKN